MSSTQTSPLAVAGAIATWLVIALGLHAASMNRLGEVEAQVRDARVGIEHRLTRLEVSVEQLALKRARLASRVPAPKEEGG